MINKGDYAEWFTRYTWELFVTTRYPPSIHSDQAHHLLIENVLRPIAKTAKDTIGAITVFMPPTQAQPQCHSHSAILSKHRSLTSNIDLLIFELYNSKSAIISHDKEVDILPFRPLDLPGVKGHPTYLAENIASNSNYDIQYYGKKLLIKEIQNEPCAMH